MAAKKRSEVGAHAKRRATGDKMLSHWFKGETIAQIKRLSIKWGMGFDRDVIAKAIELAAKAPT